MPHVDSELKIQKTPISSNVNAERERDENQYSGSRENRSLAVVLPTQQVHARDGRIRENTTESKFSLQKSDCVSEDYLNRIL